MEEQTTQPSHQILEEAPIESGEIKDIEGGGIKYLDFIESAFVEPFHEAKHRADTSRKLAYMLVIFLGISWLLHYAGMLFCEWYGKHDAAENLSKAFSSWLPIISGLVGGAVTYYFTRESDFMRESKRALL